MEFLFNAFVAICTTLTVFIMTIFSFVVWPFGAAISKLRWGHVIFTFGNLCDTFLDLWKDNVGGHWAQTFNIKRKRK